MSGFLVYQAQGADPDVRRLSRDIVDTVLCAARAGGFAKGDILETMMAMGVAFGRMWDLAEEATRAIGDSAAFIKVLQQAGVRWEGGQ
jgi:hypothetical protein